MVDEWMNRQTETGDDRLVAYTQTLTSAQYQYAIPPSERYTTVIKSNTQQTAIEKPQIMRRKCLRQGYLPMQADQTGGEPRI